MRAEDLTFAEELRVKLQKYSSSERELRGFSEDGAIDSFIFQVVESVRRIRFIREIAKRQLSPMRADPVSLLFDPIRAALIKHNSGDFDEACWLVFLFTHFGKNRKSGYQLIRDVYSGTLQSGCWTWERMTKDVKAFRQWLDESKQELKSGSIHRGFGNHRKYQSLDAWTANGTGATVASYVDWIVAHEGHKSLFDSALADAQGDPEVAFAALYRSMRAVRGFGRTARFDYLTMIGKLGLSELRADSVYFTGASGPVDGAKLLFFGKKNASIEASKLGGMTDHFATSLGLDKQVVEDSLCNWQKSPTKIKPFRG